MVYFIPLFFLMVSAALDFFCKKDKLTTAIKISFSGFGLLFLFYLTAFKGNIDPDYLSYLNIYNNTPPLTSLSEETLAEARDKAYGIEYGILFLIGLIKAIGGSYQLLLIFFASTSIFLIYKLSKTFNRMHYFIVFALVALFYQGVYIQIRFATACFFLYVSVFYYLNKSDDRYNKIKSLFYFIFGALLHNVWVIILFFPIVIKLRDFFVRHIIVLFLLTLPLSFLGATDFISFTIENFLSRYNTYLLEYEDFSGSKFPYYWRLILNLSLFYLLIFREKKIIHEISAVERLLLAFLFLNLASWAVGYNFPILYRVSWFFDVGYIFFILGFSRSQFLFKKIFFFVLFTIYLFYRVNNGMSSFSDFYIDWV
ncbi:EpsG family protein [Pseudoalteromonas rhizosphaerae]|uniref:EpsG family protein n=1 Tax=Pseudoalteromonas rhizosphaerae TaxID=2518973 RepID=UPI0037038B5D